MSFTRHMLRCASVVHTARNLPKLLPQKCCKPCLLNNNNVAPGNNMLTKRFVSTEGDVDLVQFLKEEISYESDNVSETPKFKNFKVDMSGTEVKLTRNYEKENIEVLFDINENINMDEGEAKEEHLEDDEERINDDITSYPTFTVKIVKASGKTLHFNCACSTNHTEEVDVESDEDEQYELFRFDSVKIYDGAEKDSYEAETETMDGELYSMLMTTLLERGVDGSFVNNLIDLSTTVEHRHYINFLQELKSFAADK